MIFMPEWFLIVGLLALLTGLGYTWKPLLLATPLLLFALGAPVAHAIASGIRTCRSGPTRNFFEKVRLMSVTTLLHLLQPLARLFGRVRWGLTPWRWVKAESPSLPRANSIVLWSEVWHAAQDRLEEVESTLKKLGLVVLSTLIAISVGAGTARAWTACATLTMMGLLLGLSVLQECEAATDVGLRVVQKREVEHSSAQLVSGHSKGAIHAVPQSMTNCVPVIGPIVEGKD